MKNELIITDDVSQDSLNLIIDNACSFFNDLLLENGIKTMVKIERNTDVPEVIDITFDGIELGSYGIRKCKFLDWVFGTGIAEPRFSTVIRKSNGVSS